MAYLTYKFFARVARRQRGDDENRRKRKSPPCARGMWALQRSGVSLARPKPLARGASGRQSPLRAGHVVKGYRKGFRIDLAPQSPLRARYVGISSCDFSNSNQGPLRAGHVAQGAPTREEP
ncbi:MAG TPA: hypothetical protein IAA75_08645 [Candidatus Pullichristensenella avicola]|nr:hypothetical protein [Candidatus Pullichristensenella avicola]